MVKPRFIKRALPLVLPALARDAVLNVEYPLMLSFMIILLCGGMH